MVAVALAAEPREGELGLLAAEAEVLGTFGQHHHPPQQVVVLAEEFVGVGGGVQHGGGLPGLLEVAGGEVGGLPAVLQMDVHPGAGRVGAVQVGRAVGGVLRILRVLGGLVVLGAGLPGRAGVGGAAGALQQQKARHKAEPCQQGGAAHLPGRQGPDRPKHPAGEETPPQNQTDPALIHAACSFPASKGPAGPL